MRSSITAILAACTLFGQSIGHPRKPIDIHTLNMPADPRSNMMSPKMLAQMAVDPRINMMGPKMIAKMPPTKMPPAKMPPPKRVESPGNSAHDSAYCGTPEPGPELVRQRLRVRDELPRPAKGPIVIDTYLHLVYSENDSVRDFDNWYKDQLKVLTSSYGPHDISFKMIAKSYTKNEQWSKGFYEDQLPMMEKLRRGDYASLNLYFLSGLHGGNPNQLYGEAVHPFAPHPGASDPFENSYGFILDGVRLDLNTMPGGHPIDNDTYYGHGMTATHEIGHWMGLLHPWTHPVLNNGMPRGDICHADDTQEGDQISDTPPQKRRWRHCESPIETYNSCPDQDGFDSIHNHMAYTEDNCKTGFTPGQVDYMRSQWAYYRDKNGIKQRQRLLRF